jgi:hypothetical protein
MVCGVILSRGRESAATTVLTTTAATIAPATKAALRFT